MNELRNTPDNLNNPNYLQQFEQFIAKLYGGKINNAFKPNSSANLGMYFFMGASLISIIFGMSFMNSMNERFGDMMNDMKVMFGTAKEVVVKTYDKGKTVVDMVNPTKNHNKEVFDNYLQEHYIIRSELMELFKNNALYGEKWTGVIYSNLDKILYEKNSDKLLVLCDGVRSLWGAKKEECVNELMHTYMIARTAEPFKKLDDPEHVRQLLMAQGRYYDFSDQEDYLWPREELLDTSYYYYNTSTGRYELMPNSFDEFLKGNYSGFQGINMFPPRENITHTTKPLPTISNMTNPAATNYLPEGSNTTQMGLFTLLFSVLSGFMLLWRWLVRPRNDNKPVLPTVRQDIEEDDEEGSEDEGSEDDDYNEQMENGDVEITDVYEND